MWRRGVGAVEAMTRAKRVLEKAEGAQRGVGKAVRRCLEDAVGLVEHSRCRTVLDSASVPRAPSCRLSSLWHRSPSLF